jgi:hypothetical protein
MWRIIGTSKAKDLLEPHLCGATVLGEEQLRSRLTRCTRVTRRLFLPKCERVSYSSASFVAGKDEEIVNFCRSGGKKELRANVWELARNGQGLQLTVTCEGADTDLPNKQTP